ncbi:MAG TPA: hypothetical protein VK198_17115, partial [Terriglobales bacterium]|nr:hypothetical protein [Terriglobales bacterium]
APIPETKILHPHGRSSVEKESLSTHEDADLFLGMVKLQPGATSIVDKAGTFLLWYDTPPGCLEFKRQEWHTLRPGLTLTPLFPATF